MTIRFITDSTCDLPKTFLAEHNIAVIPLHVIMGEDQFEDGINITSKQIFDWCDTNKLAATTSAPSLAEAMEVIKNVHQEDPQAQLIIFAISSTLSNSYNVLRLAVEELGLTDIATVIDTKSVSAGFGLTIMKAVRMAENGCGYQEIYDEIMRVLPLMRVSLVVDTLTYLHRGGRCSGLTAMMGSALKIHPLIVVEEGVLHPTKKMRGSIEKVGIAYVKETIELMKNKEHDLITLVEAKTDPQLVETCYNMLKEAFPNSEIVKITAGSVISCHCGPGLVAVAYYDD